MLYITKEELASIYADNNEGEQISDKELDNAVSDYNGRLDNFADALCEEILEGITQGEYKEDDITELKAQWRAIAHLLRVGGGTLLNQKSEEDRNMSICNWCGDKDTTNAYTSHLCLEDKGEE